MGGDENVLKNETKKQKNEGNKNEERSRSRSPVTTRDRKSEGSGGSGKSKKGGVRVRECDKQEYKKGKDYGKEHFAKVVGKDSGKEASKSKGKRTAQELDNTEDWEEVLSKNKGKKEKEKKRRKEKDDEDGVDDEWRRMSVDAGNGEMDDGMDVEAAEKEANEMESEESEEDRGRRIDEKVSRVREELFGCLFTESTKLDKAECREIISIFGKMEELLNEERRHSATLEGKLDESRRERLHLRNSLATQTIIERSMREGPCMSEENKGTQANRGAVKPVQAQAPPPPPPRPVIQGNRTKNRGAPVPRPPSVPSYALVLKQADGVSEQDALAKVKKCVLENKSVNVKGMLVARSGGVVIELASDLEKKKVRMSGMFMSESMNVLEPRAPRPQLIVFDIPNELLGDGLIEEIRGRNFPEMALETFRDQVRVVTTVAPRKEARKRGGKDEEVSNVVLEVSVGMRERMLKKERVYVGWVCSKVRKV
ncbi:hypothetical protein QAD02_014834 [Eretmocerus hayati]|uniref:Uncharacterized protein n=1 Tax=Eretmocerus hayati TaxID=131215 RepID=A0ACC2P9C2_9HYME|nr:hypothetical protein QAD02_014834 [Eretmocerus hayati]